MELEGRLYGSTTEEVKAMLNITEIVQAARDSIAGADDVKVMDRGETDPRSSAFVRDFDGVTITIGTETIEIMRAMPTDPWAWQTIGPKKQGSKTTVVLDHGVIAGTGDVTRACHAARVRQGHPIPSGTPHPSKLRAFQPATQGRFGS